jgi:hypothetical protein
MAGDALASLGVAVARLVILLTGRFMWLDQVLSMAIGAPRIGVDLGDALDNEYIHDVIFSLSVHVPVTRLQTAPGIL